MVVKQFRFCVTQLNPQISLNLCTYVKTAISTKVFVYHLFILSHLDFTPHGAVLMYLKRYFKLLLASVNRNLASLGKVGLGFRQILGLLHYSSQKQAGHKFKQKEETFSLHVLILSLGTEHLLE